MSAATDLESTFGALLNQVPLVKNRTSVTELSGGLTNRNLAIESEGNRYVARISSNSSDLLNINREDEYKNSIIAADAGIGATVYDFLPGQGLLLIGYINGKTFGAEDIANNLPRVAKAVRTLHGAKPFVSEFNMFTLQKRYLDIVQSNNFIYPAKYLDYEGHIADLKKALSVLPAEIVPCNNDLLPGNFIDDGEKIWLIDYEYSGNNDACFELGNIWAEAFLEYEALVELIDAYYGAHRPEKIARAWLQSLMAKYGWTLWAAIQASVSDIDFDFRAWGGEKFDLAQSQFSSDLFEKSLVAAATK
ncbi:MAG: phosphotransferase [Candidatus Planktophila sp.]